MEPILKTIARAYTKRYSNLKEFCFIFPNKRCRFFLEKYLRECGVAKDSMPTILSITDFVSFITQKQEAGHITQLFTLYNSYLEILNNGELKEDEEPAVDFESFKNWGEIILSDFNTVDLNMADPEIIFKNIKDYKEISSNFLTDEQKEVMKDYFGVEVFSDPNEFWKHFQPPLSHLKQEFINLWQILAPLHKLFISKLQNLNTGTAGSLFREAVCKLEKEDAAILPYKKIIVVGFNAINETERRIFNALLKNGDSTESDDYIDFIWDAAGPFLNSPDFSASKFVVSNMKHFPMPQWFLPILKEHEVTGYPEINIISSPSNTTQAKIAGGILKEFAMEEKKRGRGQKIFEQSEVALVLPDETLLTNMLYSFPEDIRDINLTMGVSLRQSAISTFMSLLRRVFATARETKNGYLFFVRDLNIFFTHSYSQFLLGSKEISQFLDFTRKYHKVSVNIKEITEYIPGAAEILNFPSKKERKDAIFIYLKNLFGKLKESIPASLENKDLYQDLEKNKIYSEYVDELQKIINDFNIRMQPLTILSIIDRLVASEKIGFEGEPLRGLQVMGTLETRVLDFPHIIILSMNEGIMPRKASSSTFIPETLRKAYGLPPARYSEEIFAYYFYRLISRAKKVTLIYDGRIMQGTRGGISRYLLQLLQYVPKEKIKEEAFQFNFQPLEPHDASVKITPEIREKIDTFSKEGDGNRNFSASALNSYRECALKFYYQYILNLSSDPDPGDYIGAISVGDILHAVMMDLYMPSEKQKKLLTTPMVITKEFLVNILDNPGIISTLINKHIREIYYGTKDKGKSVEISGITEIVANQIQELVEAIVKHDIDLAPFNLYGCEISRKIRVSLPSGRKVNYRFAIDRLDSLNIDGKEHLRIVDYKTGGKKREAESLEEVFNGGYASEQIFQLFTYAYLLNHLGFKGSEEVMTEIYFVPDLLNNISGKPKIGKTLVDSYSQYSEEFTQRIEDLVESIFTSEVFQECPNLSECARCAFKHLCSK
ncbi:MAG: PD-(D/E)XK nuclease family protein [Muribaculaceae bacterium]|nr:PD-(D/E)XK nuclease family protein [Muribaculaceae bacterium]